MRQGPVAGYVPSAHEHGHVFLYADSQPGRRSARATSSKRALRERHRRKDCPHGAGIPSRTLGGRLRAPAQHRPPSARPSTSVWSNRRPKSPSNWRTRVGSARHPAHPPRRSRLRREAARARGFPSTNAGAICCLAPTTRMKPPRWPSVCTGEAPAAARFDVRATALRSIGACCHPSPISAVCADWTSRRSGLSPHTGRTLGLAPYTHAP